MKTYTEYKTFEYNWHPDIPKHWDELFLQQVCKSKCDKNIGNKIGTVLSLSYGKIIQKKDINSGLSPKDFSTYQIVEPEDIILRLTDLQNDHRSLRTGLVRHKGIITAAYTCIKPSCNASYLHYLLHSYDLRKVFYGMGGGVRQSIGFDDIRHMHVPVPPRAEQDQIVRFLDWKVSQIDRLIAGYQKEIALLKERRTTIIDRAVTKGIDSEARFKPSDTNWMGEIPVHWDVHKIKQHFKIRKEIAGKEGYDVLSITQQGLKIKDISSNEGQMAKSYAGYQFVYPGDFAMNHMDLLTGYIGLSDCFGVTSPDYRVFTLTDTNNCLPEYYLYVFQLGYKRKIFYGLGHGAANKGRWRLPADNFKNYDIPVPPMDEQKQIVEFLNGKLIKLDAAIKGIDHQISLLREYRTRLICDAVTGQIDVRDAVIPAGAAAGDAPVFCNDVDEGEVGMDADEY